MKKTIFIIVTSLLFISRFFIFISTQDVGIEHDSGWYLGVARNVAERGMYASYTNTISNTEKTGVSPSIHYRLSVQDKKGFIYFPAGVTVGPGYILPEAFFLKVFGYGWVQFRIWPFLAFCLVIPILFLFILQIGSFASLLFFQLWLWCYPQIFLTLSFESFSEHIALLFLLLGFLLVQRGITYPKKYLFIILSGLSFGLSLQTKNLYALGAIFPTILIVFNAWKTKSMRSLLLFLFFLLLPTILFESYRFLILFSQFGLEGYKANLIDIKRTWENGGSGIKTLFNKPDLRFIGRKLSVWNYVGANASFFAWPFILVSPLIQKKKPLLYWMIYGTCLIFFVWFGMFSMMGWFRHIIPGIIAGMIIISFTIEEVVTRLIKTRKAFSFGLLLVFLTSIYFPLVSSPFSFPQFVLEKKLFNSLYKLPAPDRMQNPQFAPIFSKNDQTRMASFITASAHTNARVCFYEWALVAELPPLVDRVFYPYPRCKENDILIVGPYQKGDYAINNVDYPKLIEKLCKKVVFTNTMYTACLIK
ncbi:MAG: hypothetical protein NTV98_01020 [Candidatus Roizmanbacteria bacterium]|nr:hypothetical protein [Candidatus Roizmanbacteria bacterium]